ncbi:hypothetical protein MKX03_032440, partial [Papaver bracteatum]
MKHVLDTCKYATKKSYSLRFHLFKRNKEKKSLRLLFHPTWRLTSCIRDCGARIQEV